MSTTPSKTTPGLPSSIARMLDSVKRRHLLFRLAEFPLVLSAVLSASWLGQALADRVFMLSWETRCVLLALNTVSAAWILHRFAISPWRNRLDRHGAALLVERSVPEFKSSLISSVELAAAVEKPSPSRPLIERLLAETSSHKRIHQLPSRVVRTAKLRGTALRTLPVIAIVLLFHLSHRPFSDLLASRVFLSRQGFPAATRVLPVTTGFDIVEGGEITVKAKAEGRVPQEGLLVIIRDDRTTEKLPVFAQGDNPHVFSRQIANIRQPFRYRFELNDGIGTEHTVQVLYPPSVTELGFTQRFPGYTSLPEEEMQATSLKLLEGSTLSIKGRSSQPLKSGSLHVHGANLAMSLDLPANEPGAFQVQLEVPASGWKGLSIHLENMDGIPSADAPPYPVELLRDKPPAVAILEPAQETATVLMGSTIPLSIELSDDFGLSATSLNYRVFRPQGGETLVESEYGTVPLPLPADKKNWEHDMNWNLARLLHSVPAGCEIRYWIEATDNNTLTGPSVSRSPERTAIIVTPEQKRQELVEHLAAKAAEIERLYEQQRELRNRTSAAMEPRNPSRP